MIKSKEGAVKIKGSKSEISADFAMLCKGLIKENVLSPDDLHRLIESSQKSADRLIEEIVENFIKSMDPSSVIEFAKKKKKKED